MFGWHEARQTGSGLYRLGSCRHSFVCVTSCDLLFLLLSVKEIVTVLKNKSLISSWYHTQVDYVWTLAEWTGENDVLYHT
jgi:hypothetical protein